MKYCPEYRDQLLDSVFRKADHVDVKTVRGRPGLREFLAGFFNYYPRWLKFLFFLRGLLAKVLDLEHGGLAGFKPIAPEAVPMEAGARLAFFMVVAAREEKYWAGVAKDHHLAGYVVIEAIPERDDLCRYSVLTVVKYKNMAGLLYFNIIRPFHHLVVRAMARHAVKNIEARSD